MTVSTAYNGPQTSACDGSTTSFPVAFQYAAASELIVELVDDDSGLFVQLTEGADYTRSGDGMSAPSGINTLTAYPAGKSIRRRRATPLTQTLLAPPNSLPQSSLMERAWDRAILAIQEIVASVTAVTTKIGRTWQVPADNSYAGLYPVVGAGGALLYSTGTGVDAGLRPDLAGPNGVLNVGGALAVRNSVAELAGAVAGRGVVYFNLGERSGVWRWRSGDQSAAVGGDPLRGLYMPTTGDPTGATGCWAREWDGVRGRPEWFGARTGDGTFDNAPIIETCIAACPVTVFSGADYFMQRTLVVNVNNRELHGIGRYWSDGKPVTRIILTGSAAPTADVIRVGPNAVPGHVNDFTHDITIKDIQAVRDGTLATPGSRATAASGWRFQGVNRCYFERLGSYANQSISYTVKGAVRCFWDRCGADRTIAGSGPNPDIYYGWLVDATAQFNGSAGGNASIFFDGCIVGVAGSYSYPVGMLLVGACNDTYVDRFETLGCAEGLEIEGTQSGDPFVRNTNGNLDIHVFRPVVDGCSRRGIYVHGLSPTAQLDIVAPYAALGGDSGIAGIHIANGGGQVTIGGGQVVGTSDKGNGVGLLVDACGGTYAESLKLVNCKRPVVVNNGSSDFDLNVSINNIEAAATAGEQAISVLGCSRGSIRAAVKGASGRFPAGIRIDSGSSSISVDMTRVQPGCISGGAANKLLINGVSITAPGYYTSAGAAGTPGAGIYVTGITG